MAFLFALVQCQLLYTIIFHNIYLKYLKDRVDEYTIIGIYIIGWILILLGLFQLLSSD